MTQQLIDQGSEYIYCSGHGICIGSAQTAAAAGIPISVGFGSQEQTAPDVFLSATVIRLESQYLSFFEQIREASFGTPDGQVHAAGEYGYAFFPGGVFNGQIEVLPVNTAASVETAVPLPDLQAALDDLVGSVQAGEFEIPFPG